MYNQLYDYFDNILIPSHCGIRKGYSAQHWLLVMIEKFKQAINRGNEIGLLTDFSRAFENHPLAKLYNYGVSSPLSIKWFFPISAIGHIEPKLKNASVRDLEQKIVCHRAQF